MPSTELSRKRNLKEAPGENKLLTFPTSEIWILNCQAKVQVQVQSQVQRQVQSQDLKGLRTWDLDIDFAYSIVTTPPTTHHHHHKLFRHF